MDEDKKIESIDYDFMKLEYDDITNHLLQQMCYGLDISTEDIQTSNENPKKYPVSNMVKHIVENMQFDYEKECKVIKSLGDTNRLWKSYQKMIEGNLKDNIGMYLNNYTLAGYVAFIIFLIESKTFKRYHKKFKSSLNPNDEGYRKILYELYIDRVHSFVMGKNVYFSEYLGELDYLLQINSKIEKYNYVLKHDISDKDYQCTIQDKRDALQQVQKAISKDLATVFENTCLSIIEGNTDILMYKIKLLYRMLKPDVISRVKLLDKAAEHDEKGMLVNRISKLYTSHKIEDIQSYVNTTSVYERQGLFEAIEKLDNFIKAKIDDRRN